MNRPKWDVIFLRVCFIAFVGVLALALRPFVLPLWAAWLLGIMVGVCIIGLAARLRRANLHILIGGSLGAATGVALGLLFAYVLRPNLFLSAATIEFFRTIIPLAGGYIGLLIGTANSNSLNLSFLGISPNNSSSTAVKLLDTSVLIDGRIADIAESGFLEGKLVFPQFVLNELQSVADSADSAKRNRGRRGLDVVHRLQKMPNLEVSVSTLDFPSVREVDLKLIEAAKHLGAKIVTNDFNLNKLAQVQGVSILNINELANSLKPIVLPGETMRVFILKEGKEYNQGVAYLDDGTMVVVDNARRLISRTIDITVTSVLQTTAGKMIFGKYDERGHTSSGSGEHRSATASAGSSGD